MMTGAYRHLSSALVTGSEMRRDANSPLSHLPSPRRRIVARLAEVVCPPELRARGLTSDLLAEFEALLSALPTGVRRPILGGLTAFDRGARLYPKARLRRFSHLDDPTAEAYFRAVLARGGLGTALARVKALVVMCYYELPQVKEQIGYRPDAYIAAVSRRRLASYGPQIQAGEAAVLAPGPPGPPGPQDPPGPRDRPGPQDRP